MYYRNGHREAVSGIPEYGDAAGYPEFAASGSGGDDYVCGYLDSDWHFWGGNQAIALGATNWKLVMIFVISLVLLQKRKMNPIWVMVLAGVLNVAASAF